MKRLIMINGTMGAGKTATCGELLRILDRSVFLDGDWCWRMDPFVVNAETKRLVEDNIVHLLRNFLACSAYENVIFCWVMQHESIMDGLLSRLGGLEFELYRFTLMVSPAALAQRIRRDVENHIRTPDVLARSLQRLPLYEKMDTVKIDVSDIPARQAAERIAGAVENHPVPRRPPVPEPDDAAGREKRLAFDEDAANYDRWRPRYPGEVFADVIRYAGIGAGKRALEIGIGTGQATGPFLRTGCRVTAVEIGRNLADYAAAKFREYPNLSIENLPFESFDERDGGFDLIYSATAFHWIPEEVGLPKAFRLLKSGGALALWWNRPVPGDAGSALYRDIQSVYARYRPGGRKPAADKSGLYRKIRAAVVSCGFTELRFRVYHAARIFDADGYVHLLNTYSDHRDMPPAAKGPFEAEIRQVIRKHGNRLPVHDAIDLYLARKP